MLGKTDKSQKQGRHYIFFIRLPISGEMGVMKKDIFRTLQTSVMEFIDI